MATDLTLRLPHVHARRLEQKGRGRALKHVWSRSTADVVAYMDVGLSTGLEGFLPLVAPLLSGRGMGGGGRRPSGSAPSRNAPSGSGSSSGQSMGQPPSDGNSSSSEGTSSSSKTGAGQTGGGTGGETQVGSAMITYLKKHQDGATWLVAVATDQTASVVSSSGGRGTDSEIATWVKKHGTAVSAYSGLYRLDASDVS
ncbi:hypothetical protein ABTY98_33110 [Streptomyces sp. NPDC096040]|uniref:hypothetical protein n=1 Tax=Streptomyces sp. NPDC096040 TaxID=3155541 RepID=UPI00331D6C71